MKRQKQISAAVAILRPAKERQEECIDEVTDAIVTLELEDRNRFPLLGKKERKRLEVLRAAAHRFEQARKSANRELRDTAWGFLRLAPDLSDHIAYLEDLLKPPAKRERAHKQLQAARAAKYLLLSYGRKPTRAKSGLWCKLAAVLYGDPNLRMDRHCIAVDRARA